ncbi:hypothetical protein C2845_PM15G06960 [Panicum miliaceum]|uniref:Uncharacterized protein n=1 Tax=Panicum miliaceum TaxID=4540 RepID=A0A3L6Q9S0_PANMI|nr:hypothetical protein C2845_PM15G06960 [Panicum miliaceum]
MPTVAITLDLSCCRCRSKIQKILCCIQERCGFVFEKVVYEKEKVVVTGPFDAIELCCKLRCKAGCFVTKIEIVPPPPPPPPIDYTDKYKKKPKKKPDPTPCDKLIPYPFPYPCPYPYAAAPLPVPLLQAAAAAAVPAASTGMPAPTGMLSGASAAAAVPVPRPGRRATAAATSGTTSAARITSPTAPALSCDAPAGWRREAFLLQACELMIMHDVYAHL